MDSKKKFSSLSGGPNDNEARSQSASMEKIYSSTLKSLCSHYPDILWEERNNFYPYLRLRMRDGAVPLIIR
jgi:hypothetical protein